MSQHDKRFLRMMELGTQKNQQGNREMSMPFGLPPTLMPHKWPSSVNPLNGLLCTLNRKLKMKEDYFQFMGKVCECGHAVPAPQDKLLTPYILKGKNHWNAPNWTRSRRQAAGVGNKGRVWYLPHFGVYHPTKPDQIHVVFNLSAKFQGVLLNKELVPGPDLMNSLVGVIIRFRHDNIAMSHWSNVPLISPRPKAPELSSNPLV